ncbi:MAG: transposase [Spirochaetales bacterium]|nr:transposase [Spirochaetales bacterium]
MRKRRELKEGASYHVYARINRQEYILQAVFIKKLFMSILKRAMIKYSFQIGNYCIMGNHVHFILKPLKGESLSAIMKWILGVFAQKYNRTFDLHGHVWYDRFKSKIIIDFRQYLHTFIYISNNPVKAGMVGSPGDYLYGGIYFIQKGIYDLMERPPNRVLRILWSELFYRKHLTKKTS